MTPFKKISPLLLMLALIVTLLNSVKPLCIDDALYYLDAKHVASEPLKPYAFELYWYDYPLPANQVLAPPMFPYYWAVAIKLFGSRPFLWKLWLFPLILIWVVALHALYRRFAPGHEMWLTWLTVISPIFLPSVNLMLDIPVAALMCLALAIFFRATDIGSLRLAVLAGVVGGLAMQTKYTAFILIPLFLLYGLMFKQVKRAIVGIVSSMLVFWSIEALIIHSAGQSHLLFHTIFFGSVNPYKKYVYLAWPLLTISGACAPGLILVWLIIRGASHRTLLLAIALIMIGYVLIATVPERLSTWAIRYRPSGERITLAHVIYSIFGIFVVIAVADVVRRLTQLQKGWDAIRNWRAYKVEWFLTLWLLGEIATYFLLSPIPAVRRITTLLIVSTLLMGRLLSKSPFHSRRSSLIRYALATSMGLALIFYGVDLHDAYVEKFAVERAAQAVRQLDGSAPGWYDGRWGFAFYAERQGLRPITPYTQMHSGDWLVMSDGHATPRPVIENIDRYELELVEEFAVGGWLPLKTMLGFYSTGIPLSHQEGPRRLVKIFRVRR